jgi:hypothetical protein
MHDQRSGSGEFPVIQVTPEEHDEDWKPMTRSAPLLVAAALFGSVGGTALAAQANGEAAGFAVLTDSQLDSVRGGQITAMLASKQHKDNPTQNPIGTPRTQHKDNPTQNPIGTPRTQ